MDIVRRIETREGVYDASDIDELLYDAAKEIERLRARVAKREARLEIDHYWMSAGDEAPMIKVEVPPEERDQQVDGIECRDETIKGQDERLEKQSAEIEQLMASVLAAKTLLQDADPDIESAWQVLDHAYHRRTALGEERGVDD